MKETSSFDRALPHGGRDATPRSGNCTIRVATGWSISASTKEVDHGEKQNLERKTNEKQLLMGRWFIPKEAEAQIQLPDVIENESRSEVADVHDHVNHRKRKGTLGYGGVAPRCRQQHRRSERLADREGKNAACESQRRICSRHHHTASDGADSDAEEKGSPKS